MSGVPHAPPRNQSSQYRTCLGAHKHTQTPRGPKHQADAKGGHLCSQAARTPHASGHKRPPLSSPRGQTKRSSPDPRPSLPKWSAHTKPAKNWATRQTRTSPLTSLLCEKSHSTPPPPPEKTAIYSFRNRLVCLKCLFSLIPRDKRDKHANDGGRACIKLQFLTTTKCRHT